jgi:hypothetical protein
VGPHRTRQSTGQGQGRRGQKTSRHQRPEQGLRWTWRISREDRRGN